MLDVDSVGRQVPYLGLQWGFGGGSVMALEMDQGAGGIECS
jgi:hypothetical protein